MWPLALANIVREGNAETIWARLHARQALVFGFLASLGYLVVLALPLIAVISTPSMSAGLTIGIYTAGFLADVVLGVGLLLLGLRYSARAARGELFEIPVVTLIVDRWFRLRQP